MSELLVAAVIVIMAVLGLYRGHVKARIRMESEIHEFL